jgi:predicted Zn finger-like uncharacterized protein
VNVTCDKCGKRYVISDDKVVGKASVKIRCKQCQNLISVAVKPHTASAPEQGEAHVSMQSWPGENPSAPPTPPADPTHQWFAMVGGKQQGPFDVTQLHHRAGSGEITARTYLWRAGMTDWKRAADVPEMSGVVALRPSKERPSMRKDVAVANQTPTPGLTNRPSAQSGVGAVAQGGALNDLFGDVSGIQDAVVPPDASASQTLVEDGDSTNKESPTIDPFAALGDDGVKAPPPGETTRFFIAQAGVNKRNPPWKIALFALAFVGGPIALVYILNTFQIVKFTVARTDENGEVVQESFFSAGGAAGLKDLLTGDAQKRRTEAERQKKEREAIARAKALAAKSPSPAKDTDVPVVPKPSDANLKAFYADDDRKTLVPKVRGVQDGNSGATLNKSGLSDESAQKVLAEKQKAFQNCIDTALRRNPNLAVGNITVVLTVGPSGAVKSTTLEPKKHETSDWGQCMMGAGKRIAFPSSDGETELQVPFKVGVAL